MAEPIPADFDRIEDNEQAVLYIFDQSVDVPAKYLEGIPQASQIELVPRPKAEQEVARKQANKMGGSQG